MPEQNAQQGHVPVQEFFKNAKPTSIAEDVRQVILREREKTILDPGRARREEDWTFLANRVVGRENC
ncbi:MAG: hypothetical protein ABSE73_03390 [Planctomycetota bacterium]